MAKLGYDVFCLVPDLVKTEKTPVNREGYLSEFKVLT